MTIQIKVGIIIRLVFSILCIKAGLYLLALPWYKSLEPSYSSASFYGGLAIILLGSVLLIFQVVELIRKLIKK
ncbi:hypothetical protein D1627_01030 [Pontibacter oryzae]|uniref:Uncharacterized protein n=1 Tax=Pontibacter oryzae TaxID=2304593 RepID=A0A399SHI9_9BACT|nr:hypothetical protein D1627_01030 [Pontibacter oryzae]